MQEELVNLGSSLEDSGVSLHARLDSLEQAAETTTAELTGEIAGVGGLRRLGHLYRLARVAWDGCGHVSDSPR